MNPPGSLELEDAYHLCRQVRRSSYTDVHGKLDAPASYRAAVNTDPRWASPESEIRGFWERGFAGPANF
jgi:hypothetical protein